MCVCVRVCACVCVRVRVCVCGVCCAPAKNSSPANWPYIISDNWLIGKNITRTMGREFAYFEG